MSLNAPDLEGSVSARGMSIGIVVSRFNAEITEALLEGAFEALIRQGAEKGNIRVVHVPGAFELGTIAACMAASGRYQAIICLGCVVRGDTSHFDYICKAVTEAVGRVAQRGDTGIGFGVLMVDDVEQARERIGGKHGHKGAEAALTAIEVAQLLTILKVEDGQSS
ncbi:MAG: 6,7-dimethyl-8-ribityllumazine synthase [Mariprofundaceae bacterium]